MKPKKPSKTSKQTKFVRIVAICLAIVLLCSILFSALISIAGAVDQSDIDELKAQADELQSQRDEVAEKLSSLEYENMTTLAKKAVLDEQMIITQGEINNKTQLIAHYDGLIEQKQLEVEEAQRVEDEQWKLFKVRMRAMEENGIISYLSILFDARSFSDLLARLDFVGQVMKNDQKVYNDLEQAKENTIAAKGELIDAQQQQEKEKAVLQQKETELQGQIEESGRLIAEQEANIENFNSYIAELDADRDRLESEIDDMIARYEEEQEQLRLSQESSGGNGEWGGTATGNGWFLWPAPDSNIVTSLYGTRLHPIYNVYRTHNGVDIGASYGTDVIAADSGVVMVSEYHWSFGNFIMINHGNGYITLYAHMSELLVEPGESVSQGETIGLVGSTGDSTGPHLHFEVRVDDGYIDPLQFFDGYVVCE